MATPWKQADDQRRPAGPASEQNSTTTSDASERAEALQPVNLVRAGLAEMVGTFFLIYTGTATAVAATLGRQTGGSPPDSLAIALAFGFVLAAMVAALGHVSGAHLNPAVSIGLAVIGKFAWRAVPVYIASQLVGAILGALATWATLGGAARRVALLGAPSPAKGVGDGQAFVVEALITFLLVFVIISVTSDRRAPDAVAPVAIGLALVSAVLIGGPSTGGAVNPVRALGPMIASGSFTSFWVYLLAPVVGGVAAALVYDRVIGRAITPSA